MNHQDNFFHIRTNFESLEGTNKNRATGQYGCQLIKSHPLASPSGDDNRRCHGVPTLPWFRERWIEPGIRESFRRNNNSYPNAFWTASLKVLPSARPATFSFTILITWPICALDDAPDSAIATCTMRATSSAVNGCGK